MSDRDPPPPEPPLISVIIPVRDRAARVVGAVDSVLSQSWRRLEAIVVDDGSRDDPAAALAAREDQDPRLRVVRRAAPGGPAAARNTGLMESRGTFVAFLDSDDRWRPDALAHFAQAAIAAGPGAVCLGRARLVGGRSERVRPERPIRPGERIGDYLYADNQYAQASCIFADGPLARSVGFREGLRQYEDHMFLLDLQTAGAAFVGLRATLTRFDDTPRPDRAGGRDDEAAARAFLEAAAPKLSPRARRGFAVRCLGAAIAARSRREAAALALAAARDGARPAGGWIKLLIRAAIGAPAYEWLRTGRRRLTPSRSAPAPGRTGPSHPSLAPR